MLHRGCQFLDAEQEAAADGEEPGPRHRQRDGGGINGDIGEDREQVATVERIRFKLADKVKALDALGRNLGMFPREAQRSEEDDGGLNVTITVKGGLPKFPAKKTKSE